jgi:hypothetical protein
MLLGEPPGLMSIGTVTTRGAEELYLCQDEIAIRGKPRSTARKAGVFEHFEANAGNSGQVGQRTDHINPLSWDDAPG